MLSTWDLDRPHQAVSQAVSFHYPSCPSLGPSTTSLFSYAPPLTTPPFPGHSFLLVGIQLSSFLWTLSTLYSSPSLFLGVSCWHLETLSHRVIWWQHLTGIQVGNSYFPFCLPLWSLHLPCLHVPFLLLQHHSIETLTFGTDPRSTQCFYCSLSRCILYPTAHLYSMSSNNLQKYFIPGTTQTTHV